MGEITTNPAFLQRLEQTRRNEIADLAKKAFFNNVVTTAAREAAQEIARLTQLKGTQYDDVVYYNARKLLESYLNGNLEIKSAMFTQNANRPEKVVPGLASIVLNRYREDPSSFRRPAFSVE